jgi:hypothetical protein
MIKHSPRPKQTLIPQIDTLKRVNGKLAAFFCCAGPEKHRVRNGRLFDPAEVGEEIPEMEGDFGGPL